MNKCEGRNDRAAAARADVVGKLQTRPPAVQKQDPESLPFRCMELIYFSF